MCIYVFFSWSHVQLIVSHTDCQRVCSAASNPVRMISESLAIEMPKGLWPDMPTFRWFPSVNTLTCGQFVSLLKLTPVRAFHPNIVWLVSVAHHCSF